MIAGEDDRQNPGVLEVRERVGLPIRRRQAEVGSGGTEGEGEGHGDSGALYSISCRGTVREPICRSSVVQGPSDRFPFCEDAGTP